MNTNNEKTMKPTNTDASEKVNGNPATGVGLAVNQQMPDASIEGPTIADLAAMGMFADFDPEVRISLVTLMTDAMTEEASDAEITEVCPKCGSQNVKDCEKITPILDNSVGICSDCGQIFCLECDALFTEGQTRCDHWDLCNECASPKEVCGMCFILSSACPKLIRRRALAAKKYPSPD